MKILGFNIGGKKTNVNAESSTYDHYKGGNWVPIKNGKFDGEKTPGELGDVYRLETDTERLRLRAYEANLTNDVVRMITGKFFKWIIGSGLKLQAEPSEKALATEGIKADFETFREHVEARYDIYANSNVADYSGMANLHKKAAEAFAGSFFGDMLVVLRVENGIPNVQVIDGEHVRQPWMDEKWEKEAKARGNIIRNGIEMDPRGKHVAFYVLKESTDSILGEFTRVPAYGKNSNRKMAWMLYTAKHRAGSDRGMPVIAPVLEKVAKLDRYTEATVGTAEERAKIVFAIEHSKDSTGENPLLGKMKAAAGMGKPEATETEGYALGEKTAQNIAVSTGKETYNMPIGAKLSALYSQGEIQYEPFWRAVFNSICAAVDIPPEVALQMYNSNYSASRAAINGWQYIINVYRKNFCTDFYLPIYQLWLETEILRGSIKAPGYLKPGASYLIMESYGKARFMGQNLPHIDPLKEVKAFVEMLDAGLITHEMATELLNMGDWGENFNKLVKELELRKAKEPKQDPAKEEQPKDNNNGANKN
ncbi:lambda family phage portal protein [Thalassospira sp. 11-3]|nr:lambda family phage portal protein [Thalassospira sp. 11-3]